MDVKIESNIIFFSRFFSVIYGDIEYEVHIRFPFTNNVDQLLFALACNIFYLKKKKE